MAERQQDEPPANEQATPGTCVGPSEEVPSVPQAASWRPHFAAGSLSPDRVRPNAVVA